MRDKLSPRKGRGSRPPLILLVIPRSGADLMKILLKPFLLTLPLGCRPGGGEGREASGGKEKGGEERGRGRRGKGKEGGRAGEAERTWKEGERGEGGGRRRGRGRGEGRRWGSGSGRPAQNSGAGLGRGETTRAAIGSRSRP